MKDNPRCANPFGKRDVNKFDVETSAFGFVTMKIGATVILECSWLLNTLEGTGSKFLLAGTKGAYYTRFGGGDMAELRLAGEKSKEISLSKIPSALNTPGVAWIKACTEGASDEVYGIDAAVDMVKYMVAAYRSASEDGKRVML